MLIEVEAGGYFCRILSGQSDGARGSLCSVSEAAVALRMSSVITRISYIATDPLILKLFSKSVVTALEVVVVLLLPILLTRKQEWLGPVILCSESSALLAMFALAPAAVLNRGRKA